MRQQLLAEVERLGGLITRDWARAVVAEHVVDDALRCGALVAHFPGVYCLPRLASDECARRQAAAVYAGGAVSHLDGLACWGLLPPPPHFVLPPDSPIHVTVPGGRGPVRCAGLVVHRRRDLSPATTRNRGGVPVVLVEDAVLESWPLLPPAERQTPRIVAVRERRTTPAKLHAALVRRGRLTGARELRELIDLVGAGCHSELELYGHARVLSDRRLPPARAQVPIRLGRHLVYLDRYFEAEMVDVEFDGAAYHGSAQQRERDVARDAALAARGILVVRLTHQRLHREPDAVIENLLAILAMRRRQLRAS
ncbi:MAG TPA: DUF559 domain-containing protein [Mycobacteriales bacterium]|nr:DUF559 domain-containing protein [Mycobacteriales bacterium]